MRGIVLDCFGVMPEPRNVLIQKVEFLIANLHQPTLPFRNRSKEKARPARCCKSYQPKKHVKGPPDSIQCGNPYRMDNLGISASFETFLPKS